MESCGFRYADHDVQPEFGKADGEEHCYLETFNTLVRDLTALLAGCIEARKGMLDEKHFKSCLQASSHRGKLRML